MELYSGSVTALWDMALLRFWSFDFSEGPLCMSTQGQTQSHVSGVCVRQTMIIFCAPEPSGVATFRKSVLFRRQLENDMKTTGRKCPATGCVGAM